MEVCRNQILEKEQKNEIELDTLKQNLVLLHQAEMDEVIGHHQMQLRAMEEQMISIEEIIRSKTAEVEQQVKEKVNAKAAFEADIARLQDDYTILNQKYKDA